MAGSYLPGRAELWGLGLPIVLAGQLGLLAGFGSLALGNRVSVTDRRTPRAALPMAARRTDGGARSAAGPHFSHLAEKLDALADELATLDRP